MSAAQNGRAESLRWSEAREKSSAFSLARQIQWSIQERVLRFITGSARGLDLRSAKGPKVRAAIEEQFAQDHLLWLEAASHGLASLLLTAEEVGEANRWARYIQTGSEDGVDWFDPPGRAAMPGPTGIGKSVLAAALIVEVIERYRQQKGSLGPGCAGILYCASSVALLEGTLKTVERMGGDLRYIGLTHSVSPQPKHKYRPISKEEASARLVVFCTQQQIAALSQDRVRLLGHGDTDRFRLEQLLEFKGQQRVGLWDEAFAAVDIAAMDFERVKDAVYLMTKGSLAREVRGEKAQMATIAVKSLMAHLGSTKGNLLRAKVKKGKELFFQFSEEEHEGLEEVAGILEHGGHEAAGETLRYLGEMSQSFLSTFAIPSANGGPDLHVVQPVAKVDPLVQRLVIFDASYRVSIISQSDPSVSAARRMIAADVEGPHGLNPKVFENVHLTIHRGPSGRTGLEASWKRRSQLIQRQVQRMKEKVPEGEPFLVATFKTKAPSRPLQGRGRSRKAKAVEWQHEIERELDRQEVPNWRARAKFITWGQHRGSNDWRGCKYGFAIGVVHRCWDDDLRLRIKALEGDLENIHQFAKHLPVESVAGEVAADIQQLLGRLNCRNTIRVEGSDVGQSGETHFWVEMHEPGTAQGVQLEDSPLLDRIRLVMPGIHVELPDSKQPKRREGKSPRVPKRSAQDQVRDVAIEWIKAVEGDTFDTSKLTQHVRAALPEVVDQFSRLAVVRGVSAAKQIAVKDLGWIEKSKRTYVRGSPPESSPSA